jgi:protocatechuate 3,4-dioxygenase beta subunit
MRMAGERSIDSDMNRRSVLGLLAVTAAGGAFTPPAALAATGAPAKLIAGAGLCSIMAEATEGPFYFDPKLERRDVSEGLPGLPLKLRLQVVDAACAPITGARVDIWHCDALGRYSGYPGQGDGGDIDTSGETFLRGVQMTDAEGIATFETIYPGWYRGRTTHIHFKAFPDKGSVLTGQLYFPDEVSDEIYRTLSPYRDRGSSRDTTNGEDRIARAAGRSAIAETERDGQALEAALVVAVAAPG